jgi:hypothetical protein
MNSKNKYLPHWVNARQTKEERRLKYRMVRDKGFSSYKAQRLKDWTLNHVKKFLEYNRHGKRTKFNLLVK